MMIVQLILAAVLEAGGDAMVRAGLRSVGAARIALFLTGAMVLLAYALLVTASHWNFGRLLGVYVACFFALAQVIGWLGFHEVPTKGILVGGVFIVIGGTIVAVSQS
jgi:small multidrug resistance family-3 protein